MRQGVELSKLNVRSDFVALGVSCWNRECLLMRRAQAGRAHGQLAPLITVDILNFSICSGECNPQIPGTMDSQTKRDVLLVIVPYRLVSTNCILHHIHLFWAVFDLYHA